jgi:hypothetical protein
MFATHYVSQHPTGDGDFTVDDTLLNEFEDYAKEEKFEFKDDAEEKLSGLEDVFKKEKYGSAMTASLENIRAQLEKEKASAFTRHADELREELREEIVGRYAGDKGRIKASLDHDAQVQMAAKLLGSKRVYVALLKPGK